MKEKLICVEREQKQLQDRSMLFCALTQKGLKTVFGDAIETILTQEIHRKKLDQDVEMVVWLCEKHHYWPRKLSISMGKHKKCYKLYLDLL